MASTPPIKLKSKTEDVEKLTLKRQHAAGKNTTNNENRVLLARDHLHPETALLVLKEFKEKAVSALGLSLTNFTCQDKPTFTGMFGKLRALLVVKISCVNPSHIFDHVDWGVHGGYGRGRLEAVSAQSKRKSIQL